LFGEAGGDGGNDAAGGAVGHGLEGHEAALYGLWVGALVGGSVAPLAPILSGIFEGGLDGNGCGDLLDGGSVGEDEADLVAGLEGEVAGGGHAFAVHLGGGAMHALAAQDGHVGAGDGADFLLVARDPGNGEAVVEA
jgi:hypothetical protein